MLWEVDLMSKKVALNLWDRDFQLKVVFDCFGGEDILEEQVTALEEFLRTDTSKSLDQIKTHCLKKNGKEIGDNIDNIFKYVIPRSLYIPRKQKKPTVAILCDYKFDMEHGIAIVFEGKTISTICNPDVIL
jgi:hypothetical protein